MSSVYFSDNDGHHAARRVVGDSVGRVGFWVHDGRCDTCPDVSAERHLWHVRPETDSVSETSTST